MNIILSFQLNKHYSLGSYFSLILTMLRGVRQVLSPAYKHSRNSLCAPHSTLTAQYERMIRLKDMDTIHRYRHMSLEHKFKEFSSLQKSFAWYKNVTYPVGYAPVVCSRRMTTMDLRDNDGFLLIDAAAEVCEILSKYKIPHALGGACALAVWGKPRMTADVDLNVFYASVSAQVKRLIRVLASYYELDEEKAFKESSDRGMITLFTSTGIKIEIFTASIPYSMKFESAVEVELEGRKLQVLSAESLCVYKMLFFRHKDIADIETIALTMGKQLKRDKVKSVLLEMMGNNFHLVKYFHDYKRMFSADNDINARILEWDRICSYVDEIDSCTKRE